MAHFAEIDDNNIVLRVIVVADADTANDDGIEIESIGLEFCRNLLGGRWIQTSYNKSFRKNYAAIGGYYEPMRDAFIAPQPAPDWILDDVNCVWINPNAVTPPVAEPVSLLDKVSSLLGVK